MNKIPLIVSGVTGQTRPESGAYTLVLSEVGGKRKLPIVIGMPEAQAIAVQLEGWVTTRPLVYDIVVKMAAAFSIEVLEVVITNFDRGIFYAEIVCNSTGASQDDIIRLEARTSDAVALALKFKCPIYTYEPVLSQAGFEWDFTEQGLPNNTPNLESLDCKELNELLEKAIQREDYELASQVRDEIKRRNI